MDIRFRVGQDGPGNDFTPRRPPAVVDVAGLERDQEQLAGSAIGSEFLVTLAHELRTPITSLRTSFDMLKDRSGGPTRMQDVRSLVENMERSIARIERQVNDLLEAGYLRAGSVTLRKSAVSPGPIIAEAMSQVSPFAAWRKVAIDLSLAEDVPDVEVDPARLQQIVFNLLSNAVKFSPTGGTVTVRCFVADEPPVESDDVLVVTAKGMANSARVALRVPQLCVSVADHGPGIGRDQQRKIFLPFYKVRTSSDDEGAGAGAGLGLTIALGLVQLHDGSMWVRSERGAGAEIGFSIPIGGLT